MNNIQSVIREIENVNLKEEGAIELLSELISTRLKKLPAFLSELNVGESVIRSRYLNDNEDFHRGIQDYSYNPYPEHIKIGRANFAGQPIFYGSRYRITSLAEVRFIYANREKEEARYSTGAWEAVENIQLAAIVTPELIRKHNAKELFGLADYIEETEKKFESDEEIGGFLELYRFIAAKYSEPIIEGEEYKYKITAVFSNFIYNKLQVAGGILYQSVQQPEYFNVALKQQILDQGKMRLTTAYKNTYVRNGPMSFHEVEPIAASMIDYDSNLIRWE